MTGALYLTDGTTRINLYTGIDGFNLDRWDPSIAAAKDTWRESPLSDGRKLAMSKWANAIETMSFVVSRFIQDDVIADTQELRRLLEQAKQYFIGGSDVPVWLEARGTCETNTRYATICNYSTSNDSDPYHKPFDLDHPAMSPWTLVLERQHWRDQPPGSSTCIQLSATQDYYDASDDDFVPTESADDCYVEHLAGVINLNNAFMYFGAGAAGATYGSGTRFRSVNIPQGAMILNSYIKFESNAAYAVDNCNVIISGDDTDNSAIFSTYADYIGRALTTAHIHWDIIAHWVAGTYYQTSDISTVIQEIVSRVGWVSGNALSIIIDNNGSSVNALRGPVSWNHAAVRYEPHLYVWWFDSTTRTFGRTATCNNEVYVANKHNQAQLTHIYVDDGGVFGANLVGAALPFQFLPAVPAVNDAVYFGISTLAVDSGPFCSLVFDISIAQVDCTTITWQYWNGGAWGALSPLGQAIDNTNANGLLTGDAFDTTGVNSVHWEHPSNWATTAVNGVTGYWVRALVGVVGGAPAAPTQANRDIYTIVTPYVETLAAQVPGDIQALINLRLHTQSSRYQPGGGPMGTLTASDTFRVWAGLRSYSRGANFTPFINLADEQNQANIAITWAGAAAAATSVTTPTGRYTSYAPGAATALTPITYVTISNPLCNEYFGKFRAFVRAALVGGAVGTVGLRLNILPVNIGTAIVYSTDIKYLVNTGALVTRPELIDFGQITLPPGKRDESDSYSSLSIMISAVTLSAAASVSMVDLILLPCDECFFDTESPNLEITLSFGQIILVPGQRRLDATSLTPRVFANSSINYDSTGYKIMGWPIHITTPVILQPNERQRWWFLSQAQIPTSVLISSYSCAYSVQSWKVSRYLSMRGAR